MFLSALPLIGLFFRNLHKRWHAKLKTACSHDCHTDNMSPESKSKLEAGLESARQGHIKPWGSFVKYAIDDRDWDKIESALVIEKFGQELILNLCNQDCFNREVFTDDFDWYVYDGALQARLHATTSVDERVFLHDEFCTVEQPWDECFGDPDNE